MYSFSYLEPVCCSMSSSNCCFLTCIQVSQEAGQVVWYAHLFQNFPQFIVIHKVLCIVNKAEIDFFFFLELSCFFTDPADVGNLICGSPAILEGCNPWWLCHSCLLIRQEILHFSVSSWLFQNFHVGGDTSFQIPQSICLEVPCRANAAFT